jgi:hypothetical protein
MVVKGKMTLDEALRVLAGRHTRDDDHTGFMVEAGPVRAFSGWELQDYVEAWRVVREHLHMQTERPR